MKKLLLFITTCSVFLFLGALPVSAACTLNIDGPVDGVTNNWALAGPVSWSFSGDNQWPVQIGVLLSNTTQDHSDGSTIYERDRDANTDWVMDPWVGHFTIVGDVPPVNGWEGPLLAGNYYHLRIWADGEIGQGCEADAYVQTNPFGGGAVDDASQLLVNGVSSIKQTIFDTGGMIWPYAMAVILFFLILRYGMKLFKQWWNRPQNYG
jgi:hypothetical protein